MDAPKEFELVKTTDTFDIYPSEADRASDDKSYMTSSIYAARADVPVEAVKREADTVGFGFLEVGAKADARVASMQEFDKARSEAIQNLNLEGLYDSDKDQQERSEFVQNTKSPETYSLARLKGSYDYVSARASSRYTTAMKIADRMVAEEDPSILSVIGDFLGVLVSAPVDALRLGGFDRTDAAENFRALLVADIPEAEFNTRVEELLKSAADAGILQDSNFLYLSSQAENFRELGEGRTGTLEKLGTVADLVTLGVGTVSKAMKVVGAAKSTTAMVSALSGPKDAARVLMEGLEKPGTDLATSAGVSRHIRPSFGRHPESLGAEKEWFAPGSKLAGDVSKRNTYLDIIRSLQFSKTISPDLVDKSAPAALKKLSEEVDANSYNRVLDMSINTDDQGNLIGTLTYGRKDGLPFGQGRGSSRSSKSGAVKLARQLGGEVRTINRGGQDLFVVDVNKFLPTEGLASELSLSEIGTHFLRNFGGTFLVIPDRLNALAKRGEGVLSRGMVQVQKAYKKAVSGVSKGEKETIERIFYELRDGDRLSHFRRTLTPAEFRSEWAVLSDTPPSQRAENLFFETQKLNDAIYFLKANNVLKRLVDKGFDKTVDFTKARADGTIDKFSMPVKAVGKDEIDDRVLNPITGQSWNAEDLPDTQQAFLVQGGYRNDVDGRVAKYLAFDSSDVSLTRNLQLSDVMGYNPGGPRLYQYLNHYLKQASEFTLMSGKVVSGRAKTFMGTATRQEAEIAVREINEVLAKARETLPGLNDLPLSEALSAVRGLDEGFDEIILSNNSWNTSIETAEDFADFFARHGLDPRKNVGAAAKDDIVAIGDDAGNLSFPEEGMSEEDMFTLSVNSPRNGPRLDKPLLGFGGVQAETVSPLDTIQSDFLRVMHDRAFQAYSFQAVNGWLKGAKSFIKNYDEVSGMSPLRAMNAADVSDVSKEGRAYIDARTAINRVLGTEQTRFEKIWEGKMNRLAEWVYDKGKKKTALTIMRNSKNPIEYLRGWSFDARLGLLAPDQLIVQSSQATNILAIMGATRAPEWLQATATHLPVRLAQAAINRHGFKDAESILREIGRRTSAATGLSEDEFVDFARWVNDSGRLEVGSEVAELSMNDMVLARGTFGKLRQASRLFFNEGEKFPRSVALRVAWNEYRKKYPKASLYSDHAYNTITLRQDALTAAMTRASAAPWQKGVLSIPFQFLSYITRMMESLFTDRLLSKAERARLFAAQAVFWGTAGLGGGKMLDAYILEGDIEMDEDTYTLLRYGVIDSIIQAMTGSESVIGGRLAPAEGISQLIDNWSDNNFVEIVGGPSATLVKDVGEDIWTGMIGALTGNASMAEVDLTATLRNISSFNRMYQAWFIHQLGTYFSRNNDPIVDGLTNADAFLQVLGFTPEEALRTYSATDFMKSQDELVSQHINRVRDIVQEITEAVKAEEFEKVKALEDKLGIFISITPMWAQDRLKRVLAPQIGTMADNIWSRVVERGHHLVKENTER